MGNTVFDEQGNWRGIKSVIPGEFVVAASTISDGIKVVYTVPTGNTLYLISANVYIEAVATGGFSLYIAYSSPLWQLNMLAGVIEVNYPAIVPPYTPTVPLPISAGTQIEVYSSAAGLSVDGQIVGWLE